MTATAGQALAAARAKVGHSCRQGMCLAEVRALYGIGGGIPDATGAWARAIGKQGGTPPPGAPVFWTGGSHGHGHIAVMDVGGYIISTDAPSGGRWGRVPLAWPGQRWGVRLAGWATGWNGATIPGLEAAPPTGGGSRVNLADLHYGMRGSESVKALQNALNAHPLQHGATLPVTGNYLEQTDAEVRKCQAQHGLGHDPVKGSYVGPRQAAHLGLA